MSGRVSPAGNRPSILYFRSMAESVHPSVLLPPSYRVAGRCAHLIRTEGELTKLQKLKSGLMSDLLSGNVRVSKGD